MKIDLHQHSHYSYDSIASIDDIFQRASQDGIQVVGLTDHDNVDGVFKFRKMSKKFEEIISIGGIEIKTKFKDNDIHILGYGLNIESSLLKNYIGTCKNTDKINFNEWVTIMNELGYRLNRDDIYIWYQQRFSTNFIPENPPQWLRYHFLKEYLNLPSLADAKLISRRARRIQRYIRRPDISNAIRALRHSNAVIFLAHAGKLFERNEDVFNELMTYDFDGIEVFHPENSTSQINKLLMISNAQNMLVSAGSDYHGNMYPFEHDEFILDCPNEQAKSLLDVLLEAEIRATEQNIYEG